MSQLRTTLGTAGAALLLVVAAFSAGASSVPEAPAPAPAAPAPAPLDSLAAPDEGDRDDAESGFGTLAITTSREMLYVPITPCRVVNTSTGSGTPMGPSTTRNFYVAGTTGFPAQGGKSGGCGVPTGAMAVSATILALEPSRSGRLKAWPAGVAEPSAATLYYTSASTSTGITVTLRSGAGTDLTIKNFTATTDVVIDVTGYYLPQMQAYISSTGTVIDQSGRLVSSTRTATGNYTLVWDRDISTCSGVASSDLTGYIVSVYTSGTSSYVYVYNNAGAASDYWFNVSIHC